MYFRAIRRPDGVKHVMRVQGYVIYFDLNRNGGMVSFSPLNRRGAALVSRDCAYAWFAALLGALREGVLEMYTHLPGAAVRRIDTITLARGELAKGREEIAEGKINLSPVEWAYKHDGYQVRGRTMELRKCA